MPSPYSRVGGFTVAFTPELYATRFFVTELTITRPDDWHVHLRDGNALQHTCADLARYFDVTPRVAMLSYSSFGSAAGPSPKKMREATELVRQRRPDLEIDGEIQVDIATATEVRSEEFPFSTLKEDANVFVFPNLDSANIAYQMLERVGGAEVIGPVLLGMHKPVNVLQMGCSVQSIVNLAAITALRAQGEQFLF